MALANPMLDRARSLPTYLGIVPKFSGDRHAGLLSRGEAGEKGKSRTWYAFPFADGPDSVHNGKYGQIIQP